MNELNNPLLNRPFGAPVKQEDMDWMDAREEHGSRTASGKVFSLGRNLKQAVLFAEPVHYKDAQGKWQEIDNTLISVGSGKSGCALMNKRNGNLRVTMRSSDEHKMIELADSKGRSVSWRYPLADASAPEIMVQKKAVRAGNDKRRDVLDQLESKAVYRAIFPQTDLYCTVRGDSFKDELVFSQYPDMSTLSLIMTAPDMKATLQKDGAISLVDGNGEEAFVLPAPFMEDAEGSIIMVKVLLRETDEAGVWHVMYAFDDEWLKNAAYPVRLDPAVRTVWHSNVIEDNYVSSKNPGTVQPYGNSNLNITKNSSTYGDCMTFLRFTDDALPTIDSSYYITKALLYMALKSQPTQSTSVYLHEVLDDWHSNTICWNNKPNVANMPLDYVYFASSATVNSYKYYDISNLVRKWYSGDGQNYGVRFSSETTTSMSFLSSDTVYYKPYIAINFISLAGLESSLAYEEQPVGRAGTGHVSLYNGNLVFEHGETSMNGELMPVSVSRWYNSCFAKKDIFKAGNGWHFSANQFLYKEELPTNTSSNSTDTTTYYVYVDADGTRHHFKKSGTKWKDLSGLGLELVLDTTANTATIKDKGGNSMVFGLPTVSFEDDSTTTDLTAYANVKMLQSASNAMGVTDTYTYADRRLRSITDGASRITEFDPADSDAPAAPLSARIEAVQAPGCNAVRYTYDATGRLTSITHEDNGVTTYEYDEDDLLIRVTNIDGSRVEYSYKKDHAPYRVSEVRVSGMKEATDHEPARRVLLSGRKYEYGDCLTKVIDLVANEADEDNDILAGTSLIEGKSLIYHFNDYGNVVSVNDELGYGCFAKYSDDLPVNHPQVVSRMQRSVINLLRGHLMQDTGYWTTQLLNGATGTGALATDAKYMGTKSMKLNKTSAAGTISASQQVTVENGKAYNFSAYFKTSGNAKARLRVEYRDETNALVTADSFVQQHTDAWNRMNMTVTLPDAVAGSASQNQTITVRLMAVEGAGTVWFDCAQLEEGKVCNRYNLLVNGGFMLNTGVPEAWTTNDDNTTNDTVVDVCTGSKPEDLPRNVLKLYGAGQFKLGGVYQTILVSGKKGDVYSAGGWAHGFSKPFKGETQRFTIRVAFRNSGSSSYTDTGLIDWSEEWSDWQFASGPIVAKNDYTAIRVFIDYKRNINYAEFTGLFLHREEFGKTYQYDANGNVTSTQNLASQKSNATYDSYDNMITYRQPGRASSEQYTLDWGSTNAKKKQHLLRYTKSPHYIVSKTIYDADDANNSNAKGLPLASVVQNNTDDAQRTIFMRTETEYQNDNYVCRQKDARGKVVQTVTDSNRGTVSSVTDPNNQTVSYTYDSLKRVTKVETTGEMPNAAGIATAGVCQNTYRYDKDRLVEITHNTQPLPTSNQESEQDTSVHYHFTYDEAGRADEVKVGLQANTAQRLSKNTYNPDGTLHKVTYGNHSNVDGQPKHSVTYQYDDFKRTTGIIFNDETEPRYTYEYGANGQVASVADKQLHRTASSEYDTANRPMRITHVEHDPAGGADTAHHLYTGEVTYDTYNNLASFKETVGDERAAYATTFTYDRENKPLTVEYGDANHSVTYKYHTNNNTSNQSDNLGRMYTRTVKNGSATYQSTYRYVPGGYAETDGSNKSTTNLVERIEQTGENFAYTYDDVGNISSVTQNGVTTLYTYDVLGQLVRVDDPNDHSMDSDSLPNGTTWIYEYDLGGNIQRKTWFPYTMAEHPTGGTTITYEYNNANWRDQLTRYDGHTITYDPIGNPLNDGTWTYTWQNGRQLVSMEHGAETDADYKKLIFRYNADGLRVQKEFIHKVGTQLVTEVTKYTLHGKNVVHMTRGNDEMHFWYDAQNRPAMVEFNGNKYTYIHDLQGDVIGLLDSNGAKMVSYTYDAWGKMISKTGSLASTLGTIQPFRYRGYVFDEETELHYLRSRFYNATHGRFLNADAHLKRTHNNPFHNFFIYCFNNPISYFDPSGNTEVYFNVYLKPGNPLDIGHVDISIGDTTYTYGRYDTSATWGPMGMMGDGVLEVGPRQLFIDDQLAKGRAVSSFQIDMTDDEVGALQQYFDSIISTATIWDPKDSNRSQEVQRYKFADGPYKVYNLFNNNCTTVALQALRTNVENFPASIYGFIPSFVKQKFAENTFLKTPYPKIVKKVIEIGY